jgi:hypothetical protein
MSSAKRSEPQIAANIKHAHDRGLAAEVGGDQHDREMVHGARGQPPQLPQLNAYELEKHITIEEAAKILGIHGETFEATYPHLIRRVSPRCRRVKLRDLLSEQRVAAA